MQNSFTTPTMYLRFVEGYISQDVYIGTRLCKVDKDMLKLQQRWDTSTWVVDKWVITSEWKDIEYV